MVTYFAGGVLTQFLKMRFKITLKIERLLSKIQKNKRAESLHFRCEEDKIAGGFLSECNLLEGVQCRKKKLT